MKISIIIVNYKTREKILRCIESVIKQTKNVSFEIIVVDNEGDTTLERKLKLFEKIKYVKTKANLGFGAGNNLGAKVAKGEYLFFLNPDTEIKENAVEGLYKLIETNKTYGAVAPLLIDSNLKPFETQSRKEITPLSAIFSFSFLRKIFPNKSIYNDVFLKTLNKKDFFEVDAIPGAAFMISKDLFNRINGFDEKFFLYFEENDLSRRIKKLGFKLLINTKAKVVHFVGQSTKNLENASKVFEKSRFYYLRKHFGLLKASFTEGIIRFNKYSCLLIFALVIGLMLRFINLDNGMSFIGDQGWFYISARDMLLTGNIPLLGITSSHTWLHQGPLWTYMLSISLFLFNFNPLAGAYLTIVIGILTIWLMYKIGSEIFSKNIAILAALMYSVSPAIVFSDRTPFDPSVVPIFSLLYFYSIYKWITGDKHFFSVSFLFLAILYNLELATFSLSIPLFVILIYGFFKKTHWFKIILNKKTIFYAFILGVIPMVPILISDFSNGFKQTVVFLAWVIYKPLSHILSLNFVNSDGNYSIFFQFLLNNLSNLVIANSPYISFIIFISAFLFLIIKVLKNPTPGINLLFVFLVIGLAGIIINQTPSDAYLPILFPFIIYLISYFINYLGKIKLIYLFFMLTLLINIYFSLVNNYRNEMSDRLKAVNKIINLVGNNKFNLIGKGNASQFISFTMNYEYLLWWKGYPVSSEAEKTKIFIEETNGNIIITKK